MHMSELTYTPSQLQFSTGEWELLQLPRNLQPHLPELASEAAVFTATPHQAVFNVLGEIDNLAVNEVLTNAFVTVRPAERNKDKALQSRLVVHGRSPLVDQHRRHAGRKKWPVDRILGVRR